MDIKMISKKAQVTIFIIIALIIVGAVILYFLIPRVINIGKQSFPQPEAYIEKCARDATEQAISIMLPQAGYIQPGNYIMYNDNKIVYLCYNKNFYDTCINQEPLYIEHLEGEILNYIKPKIEDCFYNFKKQEEKQLYSVELSPMNISVELNPKTVLIKIDRKMKLSKNEETREYEKFRTSLPSPLYDLALVAQEIVNQEAKYCNFEYLGYMILYPEFSIDRKDIGSAQTESKIYIIKDRLSGKELYIAVRSCAIPAGF